MPPKVNKSPKFNFSLYKWISEKIVISPNTEKEYDIGSIINSYMNWNTDRKTVITANETLRDLLSSPLKKYLHFINGQVILKGCRILENDLILQDNEEHINCDELLCKKCKLEQAEYFEWIGYFCKTCKNNMIKELIGQPEEKNEVVRCVQCQRQYMPEIDSNGFLTNICLVCYRKNYCKSKIYLKIVQNEFCPHGLHNSDKKCIMYNGNKYIFIQKQLECLLHREQLSNDFLLFEFMDSNSHIFELIKAFLSKSKNKGKSLSDIYLDLDTTYMETKEPELHVSFLNLKVYLLESSKVEPTDFHKNWKQHVKNVHKHTIIRQKEFGIR